MHSVVLSRIIVSSVWLVMTPAMALNAAASPRFTVENNTDTKVNVYIFKGDDTLCTLEEKFKSVSAGKTESMGCTGDGKGQCKVQFYANGSEICKSDRNTCSKNAIKIAGGKTATVSQSGDDYSCDVS